MWITIDLAGQQGIMRAEVVAALGPGALPTDRPDLRGPAMIQLRDLEKWTSR